MWSTTVYCYLHIRAQEPDSVCSKLGLCSSTASVKACSTITSCQVGKVIHDKLSTVLGITICNRFNGWKCPVYTKLGKLADLCMYVKMFTDMQAHVHQ